MKMSTSLTWQEILLRLALTVLAGVLIGIDREEHGRPAGLRTTLLVALAAAISMIQANLLLPTSGKPTNSFVMLDLMRLPLGILTGMGFIGGGAILKKGDIVLGVTTAATLWFVTVMGLCFGGGQIGLGLAALATGLLVLRGLKHVETLLPQEHRATLMIAGASNQKTEDEIRADILARGFRLASSGVCYKRDKQNWTLHCEPRWCSQRAGPPLPSLVKELLQRPGVSRLAWSEPGRPLRGVQ
jgi:putative Mg2+ transporter-C (MgtC) family protein